MSLMGYDLNGIKDAIRSVAAAQNKLAEAEERKAKAFERIATAMEDHGLVVR